MTPVKAKQMERAHFFRLSLIIKVTTVNVVVKDHFDGIHYFTYKFGELNI